MPTIVDRVRYMLHAWNTFQDRDPTNEASLYNLGPAYPVRPDLVRLSMGAERSIVASVYTRIAIDVSSIPIQHVRLDQNGRYFETLNSGLNNCLTLEANIDQTGRAFIQDVVLSMFDEGSVAIVAVDTTLNTTISGSYDVLTVRTAKIVQWMPYHVRVNIYNERLGSKVDITLPKRNVVIVENPLSPVMNEPNSTMRRLIYKLNLLDAVDKQSSSGKLDILMQLPYTIKTAARKKQADDRRIELERQLKDSQYGIGYVDGTERITQLNRPATNNLMDQITYLTSTLYSQLGLTESVFNGTADEKTMLNYHNRTVEPILQTIEDNIARKFLTKTARTQGQTIAYFRDPFSLIPVTDFATAADTLSRNAIVTANEIRAVIGLKPSPDLEADILRNKNLNPATGQVSAVPVPVPAGQAQPPVPASVTPVPAQPNLDEIMKGASANG